jgi:hypothetical protein
VLEEETEIFQSFNRNDKKDGNNVKKESRQIEKTYRKFG